MASDSRQLLKQLSHQCSLEDAESAMLEELELLSNVYFDELKVTHRDSGEVELDFHITPSTGDDKGKQYVYIDLHALLTTNYPLVAPEISIIQSRGLSDAHLRGIKDGLLYKSHDLIGTPMLYELVEYSKDCLTDNNLPCGECAICQYSFKDTDAFTKTNCYHYFHIGCMARYMEYYQHQLEEQREEEARMDTMLRKKPKQLECPVCREIVEENEDCLEDIRQFQSSLTQDEDSGVVVELSDHIRAWQKEMAKLLWKQKEKGGVIDPTKENDVMDESWVSSVSLREDRPVDERKEESPVSRSNTETEEKKSFSEHTHHEKPRVTAGAHFERKSNESKETRPKRDRKSKETSLQSMDNVPPENGIRNGEAPLISDTGSRELQHRQERGAMEHHSKRDRADKGYYHSSRTRKSKQYDADKDTQSKKHYSQPERYAESKDYRYEKHSHQKRTSGQERPHYPSSYHHGNRKGWRGQQPNESPTVRRVIQSHDSRNTHSSRGRKKEEREKGKVVNVAKQQVSVEHEDKMPEAPLKLVASKNVSNGKVD